MEEKKDVRADILEYIKRNGPSLPVHLSKKTDLNMLFVGAFLSELSKEKEIKLSHMKVGNSPLYFLSGQEPMLEKFIKNISGKEKEAVLLLQKQGILKDNKQTPAIRVALRSIKDFAVPFKYNNELFWRYFTLPVADVKEIIQIKYKVTETKLEKRSKTIPKPKVRKVIQIKAETAESIKAKAEREIEKQILKEMKAKQLQEKDTIPKQSKKAVKQIKLVPETAPVQEEIKAESTKLSKPKKEKPKSEFVIKVIDSLIKHKIPIIEELSFKKKEYNAIIQANSELGPIKFLLQAKDKKRISVVDLMSLIREAQAKNMLALFLSPGELNKKSQEYALENDSIIKVKRLK